MTKYQGRGAGRGVYGPGGKGRGKGKELSTSEMESSMHVANVGKVQGIVGCGKSLYSRYLWVIIPKNPKRKQ